MRVLTTWTSRRLTQYGHSLGLDYDVARTPENSTGSYHAIARDGQPLAHWLPLGWTRWQAEERLRTIAEEEASTCR